MLHLLMFYLFNVLCQLYELGCGSYIFTDECDIRINSAENRLVFGFDFLLCGLEQHFLYVSQLEDQFLFEFNAIHYNHTHFVVEVDVVDLLLVLFDLLEFVTQTLHIKILSAPLAHLISQHKYLLKVV